MLVTLVITVRSQRVYQSTATLLAPKDSGSSGLLGGLVASGFLQQAQQVPGLSMPSLTQNRDILLAILKSRTMGQAVAERFGLQEPDPAGYRREAMRAPRSATA